MGDFGEAFRAALQRGLGRRSAEAEVDAINQEISNVLWEAQTGREVPRIVRLTRVNMGTAYELVGTLFPDGKTRCAVNQYQRLDEAATIATMDEKDARRNRGN